MATNAGLACRTFTDSEASVCSLEFSPDGKWLVTGTYNGTNVNAWLMETGEYLMLFHYYSHIKMTAFSPDGTMLAFGSNDCTVHVCSMKTGKKLLELKGEDNNSWVNPNYVTSVAFSPDGTVLVSGFQHGTVYVWSVETGECLTVINHYSAPVTCVAFLPDGKWLATGSYNKGMQLWRTKSWTRQKTLKTGIRYPAPVTSAAFSPDGTLLAAGSYDKKVRVWSVESGECLKTLRGHSGGRVPSHSGRVNSVAFSPDGTLLVSGSCDETVRVWSVESGECLEILRGHTYCVMSVTFSPDGTRLVSGSTDRTVRMWDVTPISDSWARKAYDAVMRNPQMSDDVTQLVMKMVSLRRRTSSVI